MKISKLLLALAFTLQVSLAWAGCTVGALPFQLQNNTVADATQAMANFNQITSGVNANCAAAGANNDITSLGALATPLSPGQGGTFHFIGSGVAGVNTITISSTSPPFSLVTGYRVTFFAANTSNGTATLNVASTGVKNVFRKTQLGIAATQGGEFIAGNPYTVVYDGTEFILDSEIIYVGEVRDFAGATAPPGWIFADGTSYSTTTFPQLFAIIGTNYGGTGGNFNVPDTRGRMVAGLDNFGSAIGAANRLTNAATGCGTTFTVLGATCANSSQSHTQVVAELVTHNHGITEPNSGTGHAHGFTTGSGNTNITTCCTGPNNAPGAGSGIRDSDSFTISNATTGITINNNGSSQAMPIVNPNLGMLKIIRF